jgi:hypothetical protein
MALKQLDSLVQCVVPVVVRDAVAGLDTRASSQGPGRAPTTLSFARHLPPSYPGSGPNLMRYHPANHGEADAAQRAGRSGSLAGVLDSRSPARTAGAAILSGCAVAVGGIGRVESHWRGLKKATRTATTDRSLSGHSRSLMRLPTCIDGRAQRGSQSSGRKREREMLDAKAPAYGMLVASIGGR